MALSYELDTVKGMVEVSLRFEVDFVKGDCRLIMRLYDGYTAEKEERRVQQICWEEHTDKSRKAAPKIEYGMAVYLEWGQIWLSGAMAISATMEKGWTPTLVPCEVARCYIPFTSAKKLPEGVQTYCSLDKYGHRGIKGA